jgi:pimeloyl-ACP methyl ester carboxylesterase
MKKAILILATILSIVNLFGQNISGQWNGLLNIHGRELKVTFNIAKDGKGYSATMDSPYQGAKGISVKTTSFSDSILTINMEDAGMQYLADLSKENTFIGMFKQANELFPLVLSKEKINRPEVRIEKIRMVTDAYSYYSEDITFENKKDNIMLAGTITVPIKKGNSPVVILISGSGAQNRDEEVYGHKPFAVLADYLTSNGIAVLRFDDRGTAASTGDFSKATTADFATDVKAAVSYLKTRKDIDSKKIGLVGHSEGGIVAPMVAANSSDIRFIVLMAGVGIPGDQLILMQQELIGKISGVGKMDIKNTTMMNKKAFGMVSNSTDNEQLKADLKQYLKQMLKENIASKIPQDSNEDDLINPQVQMLASPWMKYFISYNPSEALEKVKCPVLALNGEKDLQVPAKVNLDAIKNAVEKGGNTNVKTKMLPGLNHLFQECATGSPAEYATIKQTISPDALYEIGKWILRKAN